jgi:hypothetical protein
MKISKLIPVILMFVFVLTACQMFSPGVKPTTEVAALSVPAATPAGAVPYPEGSQVALPVVSNGAYPYPASGAQASPVAMGPYPAAGATVPPAAAAVNAYPGPTAPAMTAQAEPVLPDLKDGANVDWAQVKDIIFSGQVVKVGQTHALNVTITLKDGRTFKTVEPAIDDVINLVKACGDLCKDIKIATE